MRIFKISLGTEFFDDSKYAELRAARLISLHPDTKSKGQSKQSQADLFLEAEKGDLFYLCRSNQRVEFIGMFTDKRPLYSIVGGHEAWVDKSYEMLFEAKNPEAYDKELNKWWSPKNNSTFTEVLDSDYKLFEESILKPVFDVSIGILETIYLKKNEASFKSMADYFELQRKFSDYKEDKTLLLNSVNSLDKMELLKIQHSYLQRGDFSHQPVVNLRYTLLNKLIEGVRLTEDIIAEVKEEISSGFEKNVFVSWKDPFRILYTFLYDKDKEELVKFFNEFINKIKSDLDLHDYTKNNLVHFDGAQNQGFDKVWFAIYNKTYSTQKSAKQLLFGIRDGEFEYGFYDEKTKNRDKLLYEKQFDYEKVINTFKKYTEEIIKDNSMEKANIGAFIEILDHKKQIILQGPPGTGKTFTAKKIAAQMVGKEAEEQIKIIQFHPSYSYEDFVRGISAKSEGGNIVYETENKILASFAEKAMNNLLAANKDVDALSKEQKVEELLMEYAEQIQDSIDVNEKHQLTEAVAIEMVEEDAFRYIGNWKTSQRMKYKDLIVAQLNGVTTRQGLKKRRDVSGLARQHASYFIKVLNDFQEKFKTELNKTSTVKIEKPELKNYVLIIDEINRANLPAVLGELIYALEYRNESVESMYALDGDTSIVIPENLYIIGTMNTADRSVGHIDYAIKRRFAFVDVLPNEAVINNDKSKALFKMVAELFVVEKEGKKTTSDYLASDFDYKDVQLGHSYFILKEGSEAEQQAELAMRLKYEIVPILNEYIKDGLLLESARKKIEIISNFEC